MDHRVSKDMISKGMSVTGEKRTEDLGGSQYGSVATPSNLMDAYSSMYKAEEKVEEDAKYGYDSKGNSLNPKDKKKVKEEVEEKVEENDFVKEVTAADKKANSPAYKAYKEGKKNVKTGEPMYKAAPHLKGV